MGNVAQRTPGNRGFAFGRPGGLPASVLLVLILLAPAVAGADVRILADYGLEAGYRQDELDWNIADVDGSPNVLSELTWKDLRILEGRLRGGVSMGRGGHFLRLQGVFGGGPILDGENQDSDYLYDDRQGEFSRSNNQAGSGSVMDWTVGGGYEFRSGADRFRVRVLGGYGENEQNLRMTDGMQTVTSPGLPPLGPIEGLHNRYETVWQGPWAGLELDLRPGGRFRLSASFEHHWVDYYAEAEWNLRTDFQQPKSFEHEASGTGIVAGIAVEYAFSNSWSIRLAGAWRDWRAEDGTDRVFFSSGSRVESPLNEVNWTSWGLALGVTLRLQAVSKAFGSD